MIVRVLTARVRPGKVGQFNVAMRRQLAIMRDQPGLVYVKLARRLEPAGGEVAMLFEEWRDPDSVYAWAGDDLARPRLVPAALDAADDVSVTHYEALDVGPVMDGPVNDGPVNDSPVGGASAEGSASGGTSGDS